MDNIISSLTRIFSNVSNSDISHSHTDSQDENTEEYNSEIQQDDSVIHIDLITIGKINITVNVSFNYTDDYDRGLNARMNFFKANSP